MCCSLGRRPSTEQRAAIRCSCSLGDAHFQRAKERDVPPLSCLAMHRPFRWNHGQHQGAAWAGDPL